MTDCQHYKMYFEKGRLTCVECGTDCTPYPNERIMVIRSFYRDNLIDQLAKMANELPDDILKEVEIYAEYLRYKRHA